MRCVPWTVAPVVFVGRPVCEMRSVWKTKQTNRVRTYVHSDKLKIKKITSTGIEAVVRQRLDAAMLLLTSPLRASSFSSSSSSSSFIPPSHSLLQATMIITAHTSQLPVAQHARSGGSHDTMYSATCDAFSDTTFKAPFSASTAASNLKSA